MAHACNYTVCIATWAPTAGDVQTYFRRIVESRRRAPTEDWYGFGGRRVSIDEKSN